MKDQQLLEYNRIYQERLRRINGVLTKEQKRQQYYDRFITKSSIVHLNKYDYTCVKYLNKYQKVIIICPRHGDFVQTPDAHMRGQGCPICANERRIASRLRKTTEQFISESQQIHPHKYDYTNTDYHNLITKVSITCPDHGDFFQTPKAHLSGQGCPICANERRLTFFQSRGEIKIREWLNHQNIQFEQQKMFDGCVNVGKLRFDFYLSTYNTLIEFDGAQHFEFVKKFHKDIQSFNNFKKRDEIKNQYAHDNNIALIRINYKQEDKISEILSSCLTI